MLESDLLRVNKSGLIAAASRFTISAALSLKIDAYAPLLLEALTSFEALDPRTSLDSLTLFLVPEALTSTSGSSCRPSSD